MTKEIELTMTDLNKALVEARNIFNRGLNRPAARTILECPGISEELKDLAIYTWYSCRARDTRHLLQVAQAELKRTNV